MKNLADSTTEIKYQFTVPSSVQQAFYLFTRELHSWWPREYTWAGEVLEFGLQKALLIARLAGTMTILLGIAIAM